MVRGATGPWLDVLIRNRSLFPVYVSAVGFEIDGEIFQSKEPYYESSSGIPSGVMGSIEDVRRIKSGDSVKASIYQVKDRDALTTALSRAANKYRLSEEDLLLSSRVVALVALESGKQFSSMPWGRKVWRRAIQIKREMDGQPPIEGSDG